MRFFCMQIEVRASQSSDLAVPSQCYRGVPGVRYFLRLRAEIWREPVRDSDVRLLATQHVTVTAELDGDEMRHEIV